MRVEVIGRVEEEGRVVVVRRRVIGRDILEVFSEVNDEV